MRRSYQLCRHCGDLHRLDQWPDNHRDDPWPRSDLPAPYIVSDYLPGGVNGMWNPLGGRADSKSAYYKSVKAANCEIVGNDSRGRSCDRTFKGSSDEDIAMDVKRSIETLESMSVDERVNMIRSYEKPVKELDG